MSSNLTGGTRSNHTSAELRLRHSDDFRVRCGGGHLFDPVAGQRDVDHGVIRFVVDADSEFGELAEPDLKLGRRAVKVDRQMWQQVEDIKVFAGGRGR
ncbi:hypothetical protein D5S19_16035 [Amycolatopsis panacis]|uniref:Uncharacterized protein n=1 Tax=Amycolatopsis panacis TaxID=2340917 RepID=A0A419I3N1_9PSEU|nr:hypothetical protein D5S19_16035 [Amycolatopsis panacis]